MSDDMSKYKKDGYTGSQWEVFAYTDLGGMRGKAFRILDLSKEEGAKAAFWYYASLVNYNGLRQEAMQRLGFISPILRNAAIVSIGPEKDRKLAVSQIASNPIILWTTLALANYQNRRNEAILALHGIHELFYWRALALIDPKGSGHEAIFFKIPELDVKYGVTI